MSGTSSVWRKPTSGSNSAGEAVDTSDKRRGRQSDLGRHTRHPNPAVSSFLEDIVTAVAKQQGRVQTSYIPS